jgi:hypothetical protein
MDNEKDLLNKVKQCILKAAEKFKVKPYNVSTSQFWSVASNLREWQLRKLGGFNGLRDTLFPSPKADKIQPRVRKKFKPKISKLENFTVHGVNLTELFKAANLENDEVFRVVVYNDVHVPEHDEDAVSVLCKFLKYYKPHGLVNAGDFLELESVTHWENSTEKPRRLIPEIKAGQDILRKIDVSAGPQCILKRFLIGNHEQWLTQYLTERIPEVLDGIEDLGVSLKIEDLLRTKDFGYRTIPLNEILQIGNAHFIHGYYTGASHAAQHLKVFGCSIYYGHTHDIQSHSGISVKGVHEAMSMGCLRKLQAKFLKGRPNNWSHAFAAFEFRKDGSYTRYVPIIVNGVMSFNGKVFKA